MEEDGAAGRGMGGQERRYDRKEGVWVGKKEDGLARRRMIWQIVSAGSRMCRREVRCVGRKDGLAGRRMGRQEGRGWARIVYANRKSGEKYRKAKGNQERTKKEKAKYDREKKRIKKREGKKPR